VARLLATAGLWGSNPDISQKCKNGRHKQRSGQHNYARPKKNKVRSSLDLTSRCKETGSKDEYFLTAYKFESVLYVNVPLVFKILGCLVEDKTKYKVFA
jgi:hypothetical protein